MDNKSLNFYVGQTVEARSFERGYRGAWWRCKIMKITQDRNKVFHSLFYIDHPDEKIHKVKLYQRCSGIKRNIPTRKHLMVRPQYPPVYQPNEVPNITDVSEYLVVDNDWKVGDLVDWWKDGAYWPGKITRILDDEKVQIELIPPPLGEGSFYVATRNNLRPSLNFSSNPLGWKVPVSKNGGKSRYCAQLIKHKQQVNLVCSEPLPVPGSNVKDTAVETTGSVSETKEEDNISMPLNSLVSDTIEAAVLDLEELVTKINWIKSLLEDEKPSSGDWKFVEHVASSMPR